MNAPTPRCRARARAPSVRRGHRDVADPDLEERRGQRLIVHVEGPSSSGRTPDDPDVEDKAGLGLRLARPGDEGGPPRPRGRVGL